MKKRPLKVFLIILMVLIKISTLDSWIYQAELYVILQTLVWIHTKTDAAQHLIDSGNLFNL